MAKQIILTIDQPDTAEPVLTVTSDGEPAQVEVLARTKAGAVITAAGLHLVITSIALANEHYGVIGSHDPDTVEGHGV